MVITYHLPPPYVLTGDPEFLGSPELPGSPSGSGDGLPLKVLTTEQAICLEVGVLTREQIKRQLRLYAEAGGVLKEMPSPGDI